MFIDSRRTAISSLLVGQWHPTANANLYPAQFTSGSGKKIWWQCSKGHEWESRIADRTKGQGCPVCNSRKVLQGSNDLFFMFPEIAAEWHPTKNELLSSQVFPLSNKKVWWLGECGHEWESRIADRTKTKTGCPFCSGKYPLQGFNDLVTTHPILAAQWNYSKNLMLLPTAITSGSNRKVWWLGDCGHEWNSTVVNRAKNSQGCPVCVNVKIVTGINDLVTTHPLIALEWHPVKNGNKAPESFSAGSKAVVWWQDKYGHEWQSPISRRLVSSCPICANKKVQIGFNDLASVRPEIAAQWHPTKNNEDGINPKDVTVGTDYYAWWQCQQGHEWQAYVYNRTSKNKPTVCPECSAMGSASKPELFLYEIFSNLGLNIKQSDRKALGNRQEIDLYFPEQKIGIEFNGVYWHSEVMGKSPEYHKDKYEAAKAVGIQLIQIWEDDWRRRKFVILRALAHKLGVTDKLAQSYPELQVETSKVFARKTTIKILKTKEAATFMEQNHIQGFASGSYYVGLQDAAGILRALMILKKEKDNTLNIVRYATAGSVAGGFTKLLAYAKKIYQPESFITFADHCISNGGLYENNGFVVDKILSPDYMYVVKGQRKHKFGYRLKKFRDDPNLLWDETLTERELAILNNIPRIWDAGKTKYRLNVKPA